LDFEGESIVGKWSDDIIKSEFCFDTVYSTRQLMEINELMDRVEFMETYLGKVDELLSSS
jgi:hypothetical protein